MLWVTLYNLIVRQYYWRYYTLELENMEKNLAGSQLEAAFLLDSFHSSE